MFYNEQVAQGVRCKTHICWLICFCQAADPLLAANPPVSRARRATSPMTNHQLPSFCFLICFWNLLALSCNFEALSVANFFTLSRGVAGVSVCTSLGSERCQKLQTKTSYILIFCQLTFSTVPCLELGYFTSMSCLNMQFDAKYLAHSRVHLCR